MVKIPDFILGLLIGYGANVLNPLAGKNPTGTKLIVPRKYLQPLKVL